MTIIIVYLIYKNVIYKPIKYKTEITFTNSQKQVFEALRDFDQIKNWKKNLYQRKPNDIVWKQGVFYKESLLIEDKVVDYLVKVLDYKEFSTIKFSCQKDNAFQMEIHYRLSEHFSSEQHVGTLLKVNYQVNFEHFLAKATSSFFLKQTLKEEWEKEINALRFYLSQK